MVANIQRAKERGAQFHFSTVAEQLEKHDGRVTAVIAKERHGGYLRFRARKGVVLAAGDFARNEEMMQDLCDELVTLAPSEAHRITGLSRDGSGIRMGVWAGGRMAPGPIACMGGNTAAPNSPLFQATATLWLDGENKRSCLTIKLMTFSSGSRPFTAPCGLIIPMIPEWQRLRNILQAPKRQGRTAMPSGIPMLQWG